MHGIKKWLLTAIVAIGVSRAFALEWKVLTHSTGNEVSRTDGVVRGVPHGGKRAFYVELVRTLLADMGETANIAEVPLARGLALAQNHKNTALFNVSRTPVRESGFQWVGPISHETDRLYESVDRPTDIKTLADAHNVPVCVLNQSVHDALLVKQGFRAITRSNSYEDCFKMLRLGRVALVASADWGLQRKLADAELPLSAFRPTPVVLINTDGYIALSLNTPKAEVARWQKALNKIKQSGKYRELLGMYAE